jgi:hypothetical protein
MPSILNRALLDKFFEPAIYLKRLGRQYEKSSRVSEESTFRNSQLNFKDLLYHIPVTCDFFIIRLRNILFQTKIAFKKLSNEMHSQYMVHVLYHGFKVIMILLKMIN